MTRLFIRHAVRDYDAWRKSYDDFDAERATLGVTAHEVYRSALDPLDITVWHDFGSLQSAQSFVNSSALQGRMAGAGVVLPPEVWYVDRA